MINLKTAGGTQNTGLRTVEPQTEDRKHGDPKHGTMNSLTTTPTKSESRCQLGKEKF